METAPKVTRTREQREADQVDAIKTLQAQQMAAHDGDDQAIKKIKANRDPRQEVKDYERDYVHILLTSRINNEATKEYIEETRTIKVHPNQVEQMIATGIFNGYDDARVIHDPRTGKVKEFKLKAEPVPQVSAAPVKVDDSVLAAKEQRIADLERRLAKLEGNGSQDLPELEDDQVKSKPSPVNKKK